MLIVLMKVMNRTVVCKKYLFHYSCNGFYFIIYSNVICYLSNFQYTFEPESGKRTCLCKITCKKATVPLVNTTMATTIDRGKQMKHNILSMFSNRCEGFRQKSKHLLFHFPQMISFTSK